MAKFIETLKRSNTKIRQDRAEAIGSDTARLYKRKVEDISYEIEKLEREREGMLDLSPTNADSLILANDFKTEEFIDKDIEIGIKLRNLKIRLDVATGRYDELFGKEAATSEIVVVASAATE